MLNPSSTFPFSWEHVQASGNWRQELTGKGGERESTDANLVTSIWPLLTVELTWRSPALLSEFDIMKLPSKAGEMEGPKTQHPTPVPSDSECRRSSHQAGSAVEI